MQQHAGTQLSHGKNHSVRLLSFTIKTFVVLSTVVVADNDQIREYEAEFFMKNSIIHTHSFLFARKTMNLFYPSRNCQNAKDMCMFRFYNGLIFVIH